MSSHVGEVLAALGTCFDSLGVRWYLFCAQAAIFHGVARLTADVDVTVFPQPHSTSRLASVMLASKATTVPRLGHYGHGSRMDPEEAYRRLSRARA